MPSPAISATRLAKSAWTTITVEPESASWWRRNSPLYAVLIGTWIAPSFSAAKNEMTCSGPFSSSVATRSPRPHADAGQAVREPVGGGVHLARP